MIEPGPDVAQRWEAAPMSARRQVARLLCSAPRLGQLRLMRAPVKGQRSAAYKRVEWRREF